MASTTGNTITLAANETDYSLASSTGFIIAGNALNNQLTGNLGNDTLLGAAGADTLLGSDGNDSLDGGLGADWMAGGAGDDSYVVDDAGDVVVELANEGVDSITSKISLVLGDNIERLYAAQSGLSLTGNAMANFMRGSNGADALNGGDGNDTIYTFATNSTVGGDDTVHGGNGNDIIYVGGNVTSYVYGDAGNDTIYLSYGAHRTYARGGTGNDTYIITNALSQIEEFAGEGIDTIRTTVTMSLQPGEMVNPSLIPVVSGEVESLVMISNDNIDGLGNGLNNMLLGGAGNNLIDGRGGNDIINGYGGNDTLQGGDGNDYLYVATTVDGGLGITSLSGGSGNDVFYMGRYLVSNPNLNMSNVTITDFVSGQDKIRFDIAQSLGVAAPNALIKLVAGSGETLADLLDRAGNQASGSRAALVSFQLDGNTYVVLDTHPASDVFGDTDTGITLTGLVDVQWSDFACVVVV